MSSGVNELSGNSVLTIATPMEAPLITESPTELSDNGRQSPGDNLDARRTLNTFFGVFCPVSLSMFSACLFLRVGYLVGQSGLLLCLVEIILGYFLLTLTTLSISAISTNGAIAGGSAYYMISRALGPEFGGALGMLFLWANVFACALYLAGTVELIVNTFGPGGTAGPSATFLPSAEQWWIYLYATCILLLILAVCILGGAVFTRVSSVTLCIITVSVITYSVNTFIQGDFCSPLPKDNHYYIDHFPNNCANYTGYNTQTFVDNLLPQWSVDYTQENAGVPGFGFVFAVLFSSVTGIMNGANMSGELKNPGYSIPYGTLYGMVYTLLIYIVIALLTASTCTHDLLISNFHFMQYVQHDFLKWFIVVGSFGATFSAAAGNLIGASRYLEALADDEIFWGILRFGRIRYNGNPWVAVLVTWLLVQVVAIVNKLNKIAPLVTVCYLLMYSETNLACLALEVASAPNFRPTFRYFNWLTCLVGFLGCLTMCFVVNALFSAVAIALFLGLLIMLQFRNFEDHWGSISQAIIFHQVRKYLLLLDPRRDHVKFWRPQILLIVSNPRASCRLMDFVNDLKKSGLYVVGHVVLGKWDKYETDPIQPQQNIWREVVKGMNVKAFVEITMASSVREGLQHLTRLAGMGGMKPNTVVMVFYDEEPPTERLPTPSPPRSFLPKFLTSRGIGMSLHRSQQSGLGAALAELPPLRTNETRMQPLEYISMLWDIVKMNKNLVVCRNFANFNKEPILNASLNQKLLIDVWPIDPFTTQGDIDITGTSTTFLLQIACVLHMVRGWRKRSLLRFFLLEGLKVPDDSYDPTAVVRSVKKQLRELRIQGAVEIVSTKSARTSNIGEATSSGASSKDSSTFLHVPTSSITEINSLMCLHSATAGVVFAQLPQMPQVLQCDDAEATAASKSYTDRLQMYTASLPPTVLSLGLHSVTTKQL